MHRCRDGSFHFWDAVDDFSDANMDLLFEGDRMYVHNASGKFGAVPLTLTGALCMQSSTTVSVNLVCMSTCAVRITVDTCLCATRCSVTCKLS